MTGSAYGQQKTHSRFQPWVLVKIVSISTSTDGLANYEDYQRYLSNISVHYARIVAKPLPTGQVLFPAVSCHFRANRCATHHPIPAIIAPPARSTK
jgi:hypothetical protein